jgi:hypothetical protein
MKHKKGDWVKVTLRRLDGPDAQWTGKIIEATRDYAVAECRTSSGPQTFVASEDTFGQVFFEKKQWGRR